MEAHGGLLEVGEPGRSSTLLTRSRGDVGAQPVGGTQRRGFGEQALEQRLDVHIVHGASAGTMCGGAPESAAKAVRNAPRPRLSRDLVVPNGTPRISAVSLRGNPR